RRDRTDRAGPAAPRRARRRGRLLRPHQAPADFAPGRSAGPVSSRRGSGSHTGWLNLVAALVGIAVIGGLWELLVRVFDVQEFILPPPSTIASQIADHP